MFCNLERYKVKAELHKCSTWAKQLDCTVWLHNYFFCSTGRKRRRFNRLVEGIRSACWVVESTVLVVMMTWHPVYSRIEEYINLTITFPLGHESPLSWFCGPLVFRVAHILSGTGFLSSGVTPISSHYRLWLATVGRKKNINNVFLGCIHPQINGNSETIYKDGWLKAIFDHFHCARSLLPFLSARWDSIISKCL